MRTECREYMGHRIKGHYGQRADGKLMHRWVWEQVNGPVPDGMVVMHTCDNPPCFLYAHLKLGTQLENIEDMNAKGRHSTTLGERHGSAKLTWEEVDAIRAALAAGASMGEMSRQYGITRQSVSAIYHRKTWKTDDRLREDERNQ